MIFWLLVVLGVCVGCLVVIVGTLGIDYYRACQPLIELDQHKFPHSSKETSSPQANQRRIEQLKWLRFAGLLILFFTGASIIRHLL